MMQIEISSHSNRGISGPVNEDALYYPAGPGPAITATQLAAHGQLLLVADGQGSTAAALVAQELATQYYAQVGANVAENLRRAIHEANARVLERLKETPGRPAGSGATLAAAVLKNGLLYTANIGTCRAMLIRAGRCWPLTRDHINEDGRPARQMALSPFLDPDIFLPLALEDGDRVLLCSDGVSDFVTDDADWVQLTGRGTAETMAESIVNHARAAGSTADASVIVALLKAARPENQMSSGQRLTLLLLSLFAFCLLVWFMLELWWTLAS